MEPLTNNISKRDCSEIAGSLRDPAESAQVIPLLAGPQSQLCEMPKVVAVDDNEAARWSVEEIFRGSEEFSYVESYRSGKEALRKVPEVNPQLILMDIRMPDISGIECMRRLKAMVPKLAIVLMSGVTDTNTMAEALAAGGSGFLTKPFSPAQCLAMVRFSIRYQTTPRAENDTSRHLLEEPGNGRRALTNREQEVMSGLAKGLLYKEIAHKLGISFSAVHKHQHNIFAKLGVSNRTEAITRWHHF